MPEGSESIEAGLVELDARGLNCPLPVLKARKLYKTVPEGGTLRVLVTDPGAPKDFEHFCATTGAVLLGVEHMADHIVITLKH